MKKIYTIGMLSLLVLVACKNSTSEEHPEVLEILEDDYVEEEIPIFVYPTELSEVLDAHGGIKKWWGMNSLSYEITKGETVEKHLISLKDRRVRLDHPKWSIGFDGKEVWLLENEKEDYNGNARFYHNLYFYFYAMPFVLGDDGITYEKMETTQLMDKEYEGIKISYGDGVGDSPKDEYILYYDAETNRMEWLGYTVTYKSNEKSETWSFIHYSEWETINDLVLPKKLTWYTTENNVPVSERSSRVFEHVQVSPEVPNENLFIIPDGAEVVER
ncbi:MAG: hypothetical protein Aureis2KO_13140 [Aureisphaera sp.]